MYIVNRTGEIQLPWEPGLLEWLQAHYPASQYRIVEIKGETHGKCKADEGNGIPHQ